MIRNFKALGLAVVAVLAMSAVVASAAQAEATTAQFTAATYPTTFEGTNTAGSEVFTTEGGKVECASKFTGSMSAASQTSEAHPTYTGCKAFGFLTATVNTEECNYLFHVTTKTGEGKYQAHADVVCPAGQSIKVSASTCKIEIKGQTGLTTVNFENSSGDLKVLANVGGIAYTVTQDGIGCPFNGTGAKTGGTYVTNESSPLTLVGSSAIDIG
jgi:hypothetical protein